MAVRPTVSLANGIALNLPPGCSVLNVTGATSLGLELIQAAALHQAVSEQKRRDAVRRSADQVVRRRVGPR